MTKKRIAAAGAILLASVCLNTGTNINAAVTADPNVLLAREFGTDIHERKIDEAAGLIDSGAMIDRCEAGIPASKEAAAGFKDAVMTIGNVQVKSLVNMLGSKGHYTFLRIRQVNQKPVALFRLDLADGAVDYHEWHIARDATGQLRFVDLYDLAKGELTSQSLRGFYLAAVVASDKAMAGKIGARERELVDASPQITQLGQDLQAKQFQQVLDTYKSLPPSVQRIKSVLFLRISAAEQLPGGDAEYDAAVADFQKWFPKDPALDLLQLAHLSSTKKYTEAHQALDRLTAFTGGDAHLCCQQGRLYLDANQPGDLDRALAQYKSAVAMEPGNSEGYWGVVTVYIKQHDYADVAAELTLIHHKLRIKIADLTKLPFYSGFVKSPEYTKWISE